MITWLRPVISLTNKCNLHCDYCFLSASNKNTEFLKFEDAKHAVDTVKGYGATEIKWTGGEVFTVEYFDEIIDYAYDNGILSTILTNGTLITKDFLLQHRHQISRVAISIDGPEKITDSHRGKGTYNKVMSSINLLSEFDISVTIMATINRSSLPFVDHFSVLSSEYNVDLIKIGVMIEKGRGEGNLDCLSNQEISILMEKVKKMYETSHFRQKYATNVIEVSKFLLYVDKILDTLFQTMWIDWNGDVSLFPPTKDGCQTYLKISNIENFDMDRAVSLKYFLREKIKEISVGSEKTYLELYAHLEEVLRRENED